MEKTSTSKFAIIFIIGVGVAAALGSQWFYYHLQQRPLKLWGFGEAKLMLNAPLADALLLAPADQAAAAKLPADEPRVRITIGREHWVVLARKDVNSVPGFSHVRSSLVNDGSFDWSAPADACQPQWIYGLEFSNGDATVMLLFAPNCGRARLVDTEASASMRPVMGGIERFMREQFPEPPENRAEDKTQRRGEHGNEKSK